MVEIDINQITISVFKTNVEPNQENQIIKLLAAIKAIKQIDFDFEDCDHILRIGSKANLAKEIEILLNSNGFYCEELD